MKTKLKIGSVLLALVMCLGALSGCLDSGISVKSVEKDPASALITGVEKVTESLSNKLNDMNKVFDKIAEGSGTYDMKMSIPDAADISFNAVTDSKNGALSGKLTVGAMGFSTDVSLWADKNNIALNAPALLQDNTYGIKLDTLEADLESSALLANMGLTLDEAKEALKSNYGIDLDSIFDMISSDDKANSVETKLRDEIKTVYSKAEFTVSESAVKISDTDVDAVAVEYTVTKELVKEFFNAYGKYFETALNSFMEAAEISDISSFIDETFDEANVEIKITDYLSKKTGALIAKDIIIADKSNAESNNCKVNIIIGEDLTKDIDMKLEAELLSEGEDSQKITASLKEVTDDGKGGFVVDITLPDASSGSVSFVRNDSDGKYEFKVDLDGAEIMTASGALTYSDSEFVFSMDSISAPGETVELGISFTAKAEGTVEAVPEYKNIITMTSEELESLLMNIAGSDLMSIISGVAPETGYDTGLGGDMSDFSDADLDALENMLNDMDALE